MRVIIFLITCMWWLEESKFVGTGSVKPFRYTSHLIWPVEFVHLSKGIDQCLDVLVTMEAPFVDDLW